MKIFTFIFLLGSFLKGLAQDPAFINTFNSLVYLNPSFAGSNGFIRNQTIYRNQWPQMSSPSPYVTYYNSVDGFIKPLSGGAGLSYTRDDQGGGLLVTDRIALSYAQYFFLVDKKLQLIPSLQIAYFEKRVDWSKTTFGSQINTTGSTTPWGIEPYLSKKQNIDLSAGLLIKYDYFYFGTSLFHFNQPDQGLVGASKLPFRLSIVSSYNLILSQKLQLHLAARIERQQSFGFYQFGVSSLFLHHLIVGTGVQPGLSPYFNLGYRNNYFMIQGSYQIYLNFFQNTVWELTASFTLRNKELRKQIGDFEAW